MTKRNLKMKVFKFLCGIFGDKFTEFIRNKTKIGIFYHRTRCKKEGKCVRCGRHICSGCNAKDEFGVYGICMECTGYNTDTILPIKPLSRPYATSRLFESCNYYSYGFLDNDFD